MERERIAASYDGFSHLPRDYGRDLLTGVSAGKVTGRAVQAAVRGARLKTISTLSHGMFPEERTDLVLHDEGSLDKQPQEVKDAIRDLFQLIDEMGSLFLAAANGEITLASPPEQTPTQE